MSHNAASFKQPKKYNHKPVFNIAEYMKCSNDNTSKPNLNDNLTKKLHIEGYSSSVKQRPQTVPENRRFSLVSDREQFEIWMAERGDEKQSAELKKQTLAVLRELYSNAVHKSDRAKSVDLATMQKFNEIHSTLFRERFTGLPDQIKAQIPYFSEANTDSAETENKSEILNFAKHLKANLVAGKSITEHLNELRVSEKLIEIQRLQCEWENVRLPAPRWYELRTKQFVKEAQLSRKDTQLPSAHKCSVNEYEVLYRKKLLDAIISKRKLEFE